MLSVEEGNAGKVVWSATRVSAAHACCGRRCRPLKKQQNYKTLAKVEDEGKKQRWGNCNTLVKGKNLGYGRCF